MNALRTVTTRKNFPLLKIPESFGQKFEVIILPVEDEKKTDKYSDKDAGVLMKVQESAGFLTDLYNDTSEDIWNNV